MGTDSHQSHGVVVGFAVNQHQIRAQVTIPESCPIASQGVIAVPRRQCGIGQYRYVPGNADDEHNWSN